MTIAVVALMAFATSCKCCCKNDKAAEKECAECCETKSCGECKDQTKCCGECSEQKECCGKCSEEACSKCEKAKSECGKACGDCKK